MAVTVEMRMDKETKNTGRYEEIPNDPAAPERLLIGTVYVPKETLRSLTDDKSLPPVITVTVSA